MVPAYNARIEMRKPTSFEIILVEDDEDTRQMLTYCIEKETPYHVLAFASTGEMLTHFQDILNARPRLFIFDLWLPTLSGLQLYYTLHACKGLEHVPAIIITATRLGREFNATLTEQNVTLFLKPFEIVDFLDCVHSFLRGQTQLI